MSQTRSITEMPNFLSSDIDLASPDSMVRILRQTDAQIFAGYLGYTGLYDSETLDCIVDIAKRAAATLSTPGGRVVLSGAGTSGRLAMFATRVFNRIFPGAPFRYLIAGGDAALLEAQEGAEDDPKQAVVDLEEAMQGASETFLVGITCGLSAPYIAGQIEYLISREEGYCVLLGFNPVKLARNTPIEGWHFTFRDVVDLAVKAPNAAILTPMVGPEPITGSTRMKSGTATKILLEAIFHAAGLLVRGEVGVDDLKTRIVEFFRHYESEYRSVYLKTDEIARLVAMGGSALREKGHIYYLGTAEMEGGTVVDQTGLLGIVDASECPPTFGAGFEDVRGFLLGGWESFMPDSKLNREEYGGHFQLSLPDFRRNKLPTLTANDLCVFIGNFEGAPALLTDIRHKGARTAEISWQPQLIGADAAVIFDYAPHPVLGNGPLEMKVKLVLNALTTGAHILAGKVFGNRMVDLRISNNKLFYRTVGIIGDLMKEPPEQCTEALLRSIFQTDILTDTQRNASIREYIDMARAVEKVVPKALLIATGNFTYAQASKALRSNPIVRAVIENYVKV